MLTPKQLRQLTEILSSEAIATPSLSAYASNALHGRPTEITPYLWVSRNGKITATQPRGPKAFVNRLKVRAIVRIVTRSAQLGLPVAEPTKSWMREVLRASDMAYEAQLALKTAMHQQRT